MAERCAGIGNVGCSPRLSTSAPGRTLHRGVDQSEAWRLEIPGLQHELGEEVQLAQGVQDLLWALAERRGSGQDLTEGRNG
jgi:hypothetical protein